MLSVLVRVVCAVSVAFVNRISIIVFPSYWVTKFSAHASEWRDQIE